jgi:asparagine synthase (glutamine-hydrolysing)
MSGIVGIVNFDGAPIDRDLLTRLTESMAFRGPDAQQSVIEGAAGFGHTLLRTTWEAATEKQPLTLDGNIWLTADARIDGRAELMQKLGVSKHTPNDAELILLAYEAWKEQCTDHLIGDFAFAIWNKSARTLFCARDRFGVKPFYYARTGDTFIFSNTLNVVRLPPSIRDELNETAIADYLAFGLNQDPEKTTFRDIHRLPAAHSLSVSNQSLIKRRYWTPGSSHATTGNRDYVEQFHDLLTTATSDRLRNNTVAVSMSGGLDSTGLAALAVDLLREHPGSRVTACTNVYDKLFPDEERRYSSIAAEALGIPITHLPCDDHSLFASHSPSDLDQPEPFLIPPLTAQFQRLMQSLARDSRVALTGYDGDAIMSEHLGPYFQTCARKLQIPALVTGMAWYVGTYRRLPPVGFRTALKRMRSSGETETSFPEWIDEAFAKRTDLHERCRRANEGPSHDDHAHPAALRALESKVWGQLFEGFDPGSTRLPLEVRHPLTDVRLIDFLLTLPPVPWCVDKHILRRALRQRLPPAVINRQKTPLASDPTLHLAHAASVRCLDLFEVNPQLRSFVNLNRRRALADEQTAAGRWANLRVFALNHWLTHSLPIKRTVHHSLAQTA